ncbi:MAG: sensor histidine kinase [Acidimicrobiales bacterium]
MLRDALRSFWAEPRVPDPPARVWRDWALVAVLLPVILLEGVLAEDLVWRPLSIAVALALLPLLLWRRAHPLQTVVAAFGLLTVVDLASLVLGEDWRGLDAAIFVVLLFYAVFRWGSGRDAVVGLAAPVLPVLLSGFDDEVPASTFLAGALFLLLVAAVGVSVRYADKARRRGMDQIRLLEQEQLARELHDTVAHHVSAIAIRAQAGQVLAATDPDAAVQALAVIEQEASRTLAEMRTMVGALRQGEEPDLAPPRGVAQIEDLATAPGDRPRVQIELAGILDDLRPSVDAAIYRLAQESITNAIRHARNATRVEVEVRGDDDEVRLTVRDDGDSGSFDPRTSSGFGLVGMAERTKLLGGTLAAGPGRRRGWTVEAVLPKVVR